MSGESGAQRIAIGSGQSIGTDEQGISLYGRMENPPGDLSEWIGARITADTRCTRCGGPFKNGDRIEAILAPNMAGTAHHPDCIPPGGPKLGHPAHLAEGVWWFGYQHGRDIPDDLFLEAIRISSRERAQRMGWPRPLPANQWDVAAVLALGHTTDSFDDETPGVPRKLILSKARRLINRNVIRGCPCGCRGDFEILGETS